MKLFTLVIKRAFDQYFKVSVILNMTLLSLASYPHLNFSLVFDIIFCKPVGYLSFVFY